ncbi:MAG: sulfatase [Gemmatimonadetes bacterium]|nr:sulfatase [Gemmatimonadota bacterium]
MQICRLPVDGRLSVGRRRRRVRFQITALLLALVSAALATVGTAQGGRLNVVVIISDDHGQDTGAYGNPVIRTPNLDALAAEGTLFRHAFATTASCSPSRSVLLSGLHNHRTGQYGLEHAVHHFRSHENVKGLPVLLAEAGYRTGIVGKFHVAPEAAYQFQEEIAAGNQRNPVQMADRVRPFVSAGGDRPFFLYYATSDPHRSGDPSVLEQGSVPRALDALVPDPFGNRPGGQPGVEPIRYRPEDVVVPPWLPDNRATRAELAEYYQSVSRVDQGVGRLIQILKEAGVYERTLIVYLSDHGAAFPGGKTTIYEPGLRSPLIVRHPAARRRGVRSEAMISWVDFTPTILDLAGVKAPTYGQPVEIPELRGLVPPNHGLHGRSFLPILEETNPSGWDEIYASHTLHEVTMYYPMRAVRGRKYKLIWNLAHGLPFPFAADLWTSAAWQSAYRQGADARYGARTVGDYIHRAKFELYDIETDPFETRNLAGDPAHAAVLAEYQGKLRAFQQRTSDPWLVKWARE